jgi:hypothetical protein
MAEPGTDGNRTESAEPEARVLAAAPGPERAVAHRASPNDGRIEAQLRVRVGELEAQLIEVATCLEAAEARTAAVQAEADRAWGVVDLMANSRSWRYTTAVRSTLARLRRRR